MQMITANLADLTAEIWSPAGAHRRGRTALAQLEFHGPKGDPGEDGYMGSAGAQGRPRRARSQRVSPVAAGAAGADGPPRPARVRWVELAPPDPWASSRLS